MTMNTDDLDAELTRFKQASERIAANLIELEIDSSRQLLDTSNLTGQSATRWSEASTALSDLWAWRARLDGFIERAEKLGRSPRHADELRSLITGPSIELTRTEVPLAERDLLGSAEVTVHCTADNLLGRMSSAFDLAKRVLAEFQEAWNWLIPALADARSSLDEARARAASLDDSGRSALHEAAAEFDRLSAWLDDPLSAVRDQVDRLNVSLDAIHRELEATAALRDTLEAQLDDARARLTRLNALVEESREAHEELLVKISVPSAPVPPEIPDGLSGELDQIATRARSGDWRGARRALDAWTGRTTALLDEAEGILRANRAPIEARNQLRALLEAYQAKAGRLGAIEDRELERVFTEAQEALYTAPTDLSVAAQLVRRYQERLNAPRPAKEVLR
jgi:hypothetical protein